MTYLHDYNRQNCGPGMVPRFGGYLHAGVGDEERMKNATGLTWRLWQDTVSFMCWQ